MTLEQRWDEDELPEITNPAQEFDDVKDFFDYFIIDDDGWQGIREDAPEKAKLAYQKYMKHQKDLDSKGIKE